VAIFTIIRNWLFHEPQRDSVNWDSLQAELAYLRKHCRSQEESLEVAIVELSELRQELTLCKQRLLMYKNKNAELTKEQRRLTEFIATRFNESGNSVKAKTKDMPPIEYVGSSRTLKDSDPAVATVLAAAATAWFADDVAARSELVNRLDSEPSSRSIESSKCDDTVNTVIDTPSSTYHQTSTSTSCNQAEMVDYSSSNNGTSFGD
jgi:hypothetical protein